MINTNKLLGIFAENGMTKKAVAELLDIAPKTLNEKLNKGVFGSDEIEKMIEEFHIEDPMSIFFVKE